MKYNVLIYRKGATFRASEEGGYWNNGQRTHPPKLVHYSHLKGLEAIIEGFSDIPLPLSYSEIPCKVYGLLGLYGDVNLHEIILTAAYSFVNSITNHDGT